jgi:ABC-2 type transport system permease protein
VPTRLAWHRTPRDVPQAARPRPLSSAFFQPQFQDVVQIEPGTGAARMDAGEFLFVVAIPPGVERQLLARHVLDIQVMIDATAMELAGIGANYIANTLSWEILW